MEYFWLFMASVTGALGVYMGATEGWDDYRYLLYFAGMALVLYLMRRLYRRRQEQDAE